MKKWILWPVLISVLLFGCAEKRDQVTSPTIQTTAPEAGMYVPGSKIEQQTAGTVRAYAMEQKGMTAIDFMGEDILVFFFRENETAVTRLTGESGVVAVQTALPAGVLPGQSAKVNGNMLAYYNQQDKSVVFLNGDFSVAGKTAMPQHAMGTPVLSDNLQSAYYCVGQELFAVNLNTGISRIVRSQLLSIRQEIFDGSMLNCYLTADGSDGYTEFVSAQTGATLGADEGLEWIDTFQDKYMLSRMDGTVREFLIGNLSGEQKLFLPLEAGDVFSLLSVNGAATVSNVADGVCLAFYNLENGKCTARIKLPAGEITQLSSNANGGFVWFIYRDMQGEEFLCRWDISVPVGEDEAVYTVDRYTLSHPDAEGIARCQERAKEIYNQYGVKIALLSSVKQTQGYIIEYEHQVDAIMRGLDAVEAVLARFPLDFLRTTAKISDTRMIHIGLVRSIDAVDPKDTADQYGLQYWSNGNATIALCISENMESVLIHQISHVMDAYIFSKSVMYDDWDSVNPEGFRYDNNYTDYPTHEKSVYLKDGTRAFINAYGMTFAKEDRATIFEYAMVEGNEDYFQTSFMQNKLMRISKAIRDAYKWKKDTRTFPWEQYLRKSLAYVEK